MIYQTTCQYQVMPFGGMAEVSVETGEENITLSYPEYNEDGSYKGLAKFTTFDLSEAESLAKSLLVCVAVMRREIDLK